MLLQKLQHLRAMPTALGACYMPAALREKEPFPDLPPDVPQVLPCRSSVCLWKETFLRVKN